MLHIGRTLFILYFCINVMTLDAVEKITTSKKERKIKMTHDKNAQSKSNIPTQTRSQTPKPPFPYHEESVNYQNKADGITIAGTLTMPSAQGEFPVVLLIAGMGPMDRDATFMEHKRFAVIADYLTRQGIAVLRVDKRGVGESTGTFSSEVTTKDLAGDVLAGIEYLKTRAEINPGQIGLIGHSEGGLVATIVAAQSNDVAFVILMSAAVITSVDGQTETTAAQLRFDDASEAMVAQDCNVRKQVLTVVTREVDPAVAAQKMDSIIKHYWATLPEEQKQEAAKLAFAFTLAKKDGLIATFNSPWFRFFFSYDATAALKQIKVPLLALNGEFDFNQPNIAFPIIRKALEKAGNSDYTTLAVPNVNHNFQTCQTGSIPEYGMLEETISPRVLQVMLDWLLARIDKV